MLDITSDLLYGDCMAEDIKTYQIFNIEKARCHFKALEKKAEKLGVDAPKLREVTSYPMYRRFEGGESVWVRTWEPGCGEARTAYDVQIVGTKMICLSGWTFLAVLDHELGVENTVVRSVSEEPLPDEWRHRGALCDHCGQERYRKETYVVRSDEGEMKQVGSTCLKDFMGHDAEKVLWSVDALLGAREVLEDDEGSSSFSGGTEWGLVEFLAWTAKSIREEGWTSKKMAYENNSMSTAEIVNLEMCEALGKGLL